MSSISLSHSGAISRQDPDTNRLHRKYAWLTACLAALSTLVFTSLYWNRFLGASVSGTFLVIGEDILHGRIPYRDFFLVVPPLHGLKIAAVIKVFGDNLAVVRFEAMVERGILAALITLWLTRFVRIQIAFTAAVAAMIIFAGDVGDSLASYNHDSVFWGVCAGFCAAVYFDASSRRRAMWLALAAGVFAGCCFTTKQTTGAGVTAAVAVLGSALVWRTHSLLRARSFLLVFIAGWMIPVASIGVWLYLNSALSALIECTVRTVTSKGSGIALVLRPLLQEKRPVAAAVVVVLGILTLSRRARRALGSDSILLTVALFGLSLVLIWAGWFRTETAPFAELSSFWLYGKDYWFLRACLIESAMLGCGAFLLLGVYRVFICRAEPTRTDIHLTLITGLSFVMAYMLGLSFAFTEPMVVPSLAVLLAVVLNSIADRSRLALTVTMAAIAALLVYETQLKLQRPFDWMAPWNESSVAEATEPARLPLLAGLKLSPLTISRVDRIVKAVREHSKPGDTMVTYPYLPLFYSICGLRPPTYAYLHNIDVTPDTVADRDAATMLRTRPAVIVYQLDSEAEMKSHEMLFRGGRPSGSRRFAQAIQSLEKDYQLVDIIEGPGMSRPLRIIAAR